MVDPKDILAAERTLLAWIRTGVALMGLGFVVARFGLFLRELGRVGGHGAEEVVGSAPVGIAVVAAGILINVWATVRHHLLVGALRSGSKEVGTVGPIIVGVLTGIGGLALAILLSVSID